MSPDELLRLGVQAGTLGDYDSCFKACEEGLRQSPGHIPLSVQLSKACIETKRPHLAKLVCDDIVARDPESSIGWCNRGQACIDLAEFDDSYLDEAAYSFRQSIKVEPDQSIAYVNLAYVLIANAEHEESVEVCKQAIKNSPGDDKPFYNMGLSLLANHMWEEGWYCHDKMLEARFTRYPVPEWGIPRWEGQEGTVLVFTEQGLGDEILFSSMIPDLMKTNTVIIDCEPRLAGLFERSFGCEVHGTRFDPKAEWKSFIRADYQVPIGSLGQFYRKKHEHFPGTPYLVADPERKTQWKSLLSGTKPNIGIAWSGGIPGTRESRRSLGWRELRPLLEYDANWVSLQYKNTNMPDFINHWPRAVENCDYDDTAALISELDLVISVTTAAVHCAGALGVETWCMVPKASQWRYGVVGNKMPWYNSVELFRQEDKWPIQALQEKLSAMGIEKCRNLYTPTQHMVSPPTSTPISLPRLSESPGLMKYLIMGLEKAA